MTAPPRAKPAKRGGRLTNRLGEDKRLSAWCARRQPTPPYRHGRA
jgi:hypothetical protein